MPDIPFAASVALVAASGLLASYLDVRHRRIPNWLCLVTAVSGLAVALADAPAVAGSHALHLVIALVVGMIFFRFGMFGGGDAKFYAGMASWFPLGKAILLLLCVSLSGVVLFLVWFAARRLRGHKVRFGGKERTEALPYGVAIAAGGLIALFL